MKTLIIKTSIALVGAGGLGLAAHQSYKALTSQDTSAAKNKNDNSKKNKDKLNEDKYEVLGFESTNDQKWTNILSSYRTVTSKQESLKFNNLTGSESDAKERLQRICSDALNSENVNDYEKIKKWCVVPIDISSLLTKRSFVILKTDNNVSSDNSSWEKKIKNYKKLDTDTLKIDGLSLTNNKEQAETSDYTNIKNKCNEIKTKKSHEENFEDLLKKFKTWCADKN
ncbi:hypothetical protein A6V39_00355 [Candidatus Mycoplasma haematobovis]|uniref:Uncharacterized protein n=1 Tax=Candidatus Mycoplasma haematobovis TaxID=432608 RepID=A0A1A9QER3_9MOLU|nr:hypothetical protein [Candidatus Mycoplasma haematobovis]OAL10501.1 hypothetical protein A6V39_00355 [Candidatus Mycoplasma haematobovis]